MLTISNDSCSTSFSMVSLITALGQVEMLSLLRYDLFKTRNYKQRLIMALPLVFAVGTPDRCHHIVHTLW